MDTLDICSPRLASILCHGRIIVGDYDNSGKFIRGELDDIDISYEAKQEILFYICNTKPYYLYGDITKDFLYEVRTGARKLGLNRLKEICDRIFNKESFDTIRQNLNIESKYWEDLKWAYHNLRDENSIVPPDIYLTDEDRNFKVPAHSEIVRGDSKYINSYINFEMDMKNFKTEEIMIPLKDITQKQLETVVKYMYTRDFDFEEEDLIMYSLIAQYMIIDDLLWETKLLIYGRINRENREEIEEFNENFLKSQYLRDEGIED